MEKKFIRTTDATTAQQLIKLGYQMISSDGKEYVFINSPEKFSNEVSRGKLVFTNILNM